MSGLAAAVMAGVGFGGVYFGGLWLTVRRIPEARHPGILVLGSYVGRLAGAAAAFYLVLETGWPNLLACLLGFLVARHLLIRRLGGGEAPELPEGGAPPPASGGPEGEDRREEDPWS